MVAVRLIACDGTHRRGIYARPPSLVHCLLYEHSSSDGPNSAAWRSVRLPLGRVHESTPMALFPPQLRPALPRVRWVGEAWKTMRKAARAFKEGYRGQSEGQPHKQFNLVPLRPGTSIVRVRRPMGVTHNRTNSQFAEMRFRTQSGSAAISRW
jgi:hypothetical protein